MYTQCDIVNHIKKLGIKSDDVLMVHTSLKSIGDICSDDKTSAEVVINALAECLSDGLLLIPAHTWATVTNDGDVFDVTESMPCVGAVPCQAVKLANEAFKNNNFDIIRSLHPTHSVVAFGKKATEYIKDDIYAITPAPWGGSFGKLYDSKAKILLIGVEQNRNTFIHAVDEWLDLPGRLKDDYVNFKVKDYNGNITDRKLRKHIGFGHDFFPYFEPYFDRRGAIIYGYIGDAFCRVCDAVTCAHIVRDTLQYELKSKSQSLFGK